MTPLSYFVILVSGMFAITLICLIAAIVIGRDTQLEKPKEYEFEEWEGFE